MNWSMSLKPEGEGRRNRERKTHFSAYCFFFNSVIFLRHLSISALRDFLNSVPFNHL